MVRHFLAQMAWYAVTSALTTFSFYQGTDKPRYWISRALKYPANLFNNDLDNTRNNMKSQIQKKRWNFWNYQYNIKQNYQESRYFFCCDYEQLSQNNQRTWCSPLRYGRIFSKKKFLVRVQKLFWEKKLWRDFSKLED